MDKQTSNRKAFQIGLKTTIKIVVLLGVLSLLFLGCYRSTEEKTEIVSGNAGVYESLCEYWARCQPEQLAFFSGNSKESCINFYRCYFTKNETPPFQNEQSCIDRIQTAQCGSLEAISPRPSGGMILSSYAATAAGGNFYDPLDYLPRLDPIPECRKKQNPAGKIGDYCFVEPGSCQEGLYCSTAELSPKVTTNSHWCGRCASAKPVGSPCETETLCESGARCNGYTCQLLLPIGSACSEDTACQTGICRGGQCNLKGDIGDPCDISVIDCRSGLICSKSGRCEERRFAGLGEACEQEAVSSPTRCDEKQALTCIDHICQPLRDEDAVCSSHQHCRLGLVCDANQCVKGRCMNESDVCDRFANTCDDGFYCDSFSHRCTIKGFPGHPCESNIGCKDGLYCNEDSGLSPTCSDRKALDDTCTDSSQCQSGYCSRDIVTCWITAPNTTNCGPQYSTVHNSGKCMAQETTYICEIAFSDTP